MGQISRAEGKKKTIGARRALRIIDIPDRPILVFQVSRREAATFLPTKFPIGGEKDIGYGETSDTTDTARQLSSD